jgi:hypothetical protein
MSEALAQRRFSVSDQRNFAAISGDANPLHLDVLAARRSRAGEPVVHGMHAVLWALETFAVGGSCEGLAGLAVRFTKFIYLGDDVAVRSSRRSEDGIRLEVCSAGLTAVAIDLAFGPRVGCASLGGDVSSVGLPVVPMVLDLQSVDRCAGRLIGLSRGAASAFPALADALGAERVEGLAALSALVGMVCPGLHSTFSALNVRMCAELHHPDGLEYAVCSVDERFRLVELRVGGMGLAGEVSAFLQMPPVQQRSIGELRGLISRDEFAGTRALIVGGSRGLGALTAKALAAGGARVTITYRAGEADARKVAEEIGAASADILGFDVCGPIAEQLSAVGSDINQMYYFATPAIFRQKQPGFSHDRFEEFCRHYVSGFWETCAALSERTAGGLAIFYPSSTAIDERPRGMTEYAMAKAAGEVLCADVPRLLPRTKVLVERLPRILTDQTATTGAQNAEGSSIMLPILGRMAGLTNP